MRWARLRRESIPSRAPEHACRSRDAGCVVAKLCPDSALRLCTSLFHTAVVSLAGDCSSAHSTCGPPSRTASQAVDVRSLAASRS
eukprot:3939116-Rhodomonas_salina.1